MLFASSFGTTLEIDLFLLAQSFYAYLQSPLSHAILTALVSVYIHTAAEDDGKGKQLAADMRKVFLTLSVIIMGLVLLLAPVIAKVIAPTYPAPVLETLTQNLRLFAPSLVMYVSMSISMALLQADQRFGITEMNSINRSICSIAAVLLLQKTTGAYSINLGYMAYCVWNLIFFWLVSRKYYGKASKTPWKNPYVKSLVQMMPPLLLGYSMGAINHMVDQRVVSGLGSGAVSALEYGQSLYALVTTFIAMFCSILFTRITAMVAKQDHEGSANFTIRSAILLCFFFLPISILIVLCAQEVVTIVYARGSFNQDSISMTTAALRGYGLALVPLVFRELFARLQYAYQSSKKPMINSAIAIALNIVLNIILSRWLGIFGVTFASAISIALCGTLNCICARKQNEFLRFTPLLRSLPWLCAGGIVCGAAARWSMQLCLTNSAFLRFCLAVFVGGAAYAVVVSPYLISLLRGKQRL